MFTPQEKRFMLSSFRIAALTLTLTTGLIAAGCGADASLSPTGPSIRTSSSGAVTSDVFAGASTSETAAPAAKGGHGPVEPGRGRDGSNGVKANGLITSIDGAARTMVVGTRPVSVPTTATIRHGSRTFVFADLKVGDHVQVKGTVTTTITATTTVTALVASEVKVEQRRLADDDEEEEADGEVDEVELTGAVSARAGTCPALTFTVQTKAVATTATTTFTGITCAAIANATVVEVKGTLQADGSVVASSVALED
jgi:hypothetical protein